MTDAVVALAEDVFVAFELRGELWSLVREARRGCGNDAEEARTVFWHC